MLDGWDTVPALLQQNTGSRYLTGVLFLLARPGQGRVGSGFKSIKVSGHPAMKIHKYAVLARAARQDNLQSKQALQVFSDKFARASRQVCTCCQTSLHVFSTKDRWISRENPTAYSPLTLRTIEIKKVLSNFFFFKLEPSYGR
jgi:hypothetical protein